LKRLLLAAFAALTLLLPQAALAAPTTMVAEVCVTLRENFSASGGDTITKCGLPSSLGDSNLSNDTAGLNNGCATSIGADTTNWANCASSFKYAGLPSNYRVVMYANSNYSGRIQCGGVDGSATYNLLDAANDNTYSWRVEGGNC